MISIVIVSHSFTLAEGVAELAREMGGEEVRIATAGGLDEPDHPPGTDAVRVAAAVDEAWSEDGVLVLMDLGSALLSAEMALEMLPAERRGRVLLSEAPLVEGAVAAAVQARLGSSLQEVAAEAQEALQAKVAHLGADIEAPSIPFPGKEVRAPEPGEKDELRDRLLGEQAEPGDRLIPFPGKEVRAPEPGEKPPPSPDGEHLRLRIVVRNQLGLHARPAARFVQTVGGFDATVEVVNLTTGRGPASGRSLNAIGTLGVRRDHEIEVSARGPAAASALAAIQRLADANFGDEEQPPARPPLVVAAPADVPGVLQGTPASPGIAFGEARHLQTPPVTVPDTPVGSVEEELAALEEALAAATAELAETRREVAVRTGEEAAAIFDAHRLMLEDVELVEPARAAIREGASAPAAWSDAVGKEAAAWRELDDPYQAERAADVEAVGRQVLARLVGVASHPVLGSAGIVVAQDLTPGETASLDPTLVRALASAAGGPTSHSAILARALGIPAVVALGPGILGVAEGTNLLVDGTEGRVHVEPSEELAAGYRERAARLEGELTEARRRATEPAMTGDGHRIEVVANVGSEADAVAAAAAGAEGVGLLRTEFLFLDREDPPSEEEQVAAYRAVAEAMGGLPVILRTLDVGGDKPLPYLPRPPEANPFLGVRGLRLGLAQPELLDTQLRAAVRVAAEFPLAIMFPMVATVEEARLAKGAVQHATDRVREGGGAVPERLDVGVMVEVPAMALVAGQAAAHLDFFSIGTNDLTQYTLAAERGNPALSALSDPLHPAVLRLIRATVEGAAGHGRWVGVCGEMAGDPLAAVVLIGLGVTELSMSPPAIPLVKQAIRATTVERARSLAEQALTLPGAAEVRELLAG